MAKKYKAQCLFGHPPAELTREEAIEHFGKDIVKAIDADPTIKLPVLPRKACPHGRTK